MVLESCVANSVETANALIAKSPQAFSDSIIGIISPIMFIAILVGGGVYYLSDSILLTLIVQGSVVFLLIITLPYWVGSVVG